MAAWAGQFRQRPARGNVVLWSQKNLHGVLQCQQWNIGRVEGN